MKKNLLLSDVPNHILNLKPYIAGKPIAETMREFDIQQVIKLASNENPLGPSPLAIQVILETLPEIHRYPDSRQFEIKKTLSENLKCHPDELCFGNGSNELIDLLIRVFIPTHRNLVTHKKAFPVYRLCAALQGCGCIEADIDETTLKVTADGLLNAVNTDTRMVMLANPNNPTGQYLNKEEIFYCAKYLDERNILFVLDYAYWEYVTEKTIPDPNEVFKKFQNVIILRTFSKIYGLASLRLGYALGHKDVIAVLEKARQPFNVSLLATQAAQAALKDTSFLTKSFELNIQSKADLEKGLKNFGFTVYPTQGNFILVDIHQDSEKFYPEYLKRGVIVRPVTSCGLKTHFRITAGLLEENKKLFVATKEIFK